MNDRLDLDRELARYLEQRSTSRAPDGLRDAALAGIESTRQRPGWLVPGRWAPSRRPASWMPQARTRLVLAVILLVALAVASIAYVGSRHRVPAPFGPARDGVIVVDVDEHIGIVRPDGTGLTMLTSGPAFDSSPAFSPDGTRIAYLSEGADYLTSLVAMDADGRNPVTLVEDIHGMSAEVGLSWSPDSRHIAISAAIGDDVRSRIYGLTIDHPGVIELGGLDVFGVSPSWSPDGSLIAFVRTSACCGGPPDSLWLLGADGTNLRPLSPRAGDFATRAAWSPDSSRVAFAAPGNHRSDDVFVIGADGRGERNVTNSPDDELWPAWSPDGTKLAFERLILGTGTSTTGGTYVVDLGPSGGSDPRRIAVTPEESVTTVAWSPDGAKILGFNEGLANTRTQNIVVLDPTGHAAPITIPVTQITRASWQRLAP